MSNDFWEAYPKKLIFQKDCTEPLNIPGDFVVGDCHVVNSPIGSYRENGSCDNDRFGYRFYVERTDRPHLIEVIYPDDKMRSICIQDGTSYDLSLGLIIGGEMPNTGKMAKAYNIFWPRAKDQSILFCSLSGKESAAVESFAIYELESLPEYSFKEDSGIPMRSFGIQYEDPCNVGTSEGCFEFSPWLEKHIQYMKATAQNRLVYPINWYHGPIIPVKCQPHSRFNLVVMPDRSQYNRSVMSAPDWLEELLSRFDREGLRFTGSLTLMRLGNLLDGMNINEDAIAAGEDTWNNVLYNGNVQGTVNDWTTIYNPINFPELVSEKSFDWYKDREWAYGEKKTSEISVPMFNPVHGEVRRQVREYFREIAEKYAHHPSFEGLSINFWHGTFLWYGNLLAGYDDVSIGMFSEDTGIVLPIDNNDPERFGKRYKWLMSNAKEAFIDWRCRAVHGFLCELRDILVSMRSDLCLTLNMWCETSRGGLYPGIEGLPGATEASTQHGIIPSHHEIFRMGGIDLEMLGKENGISICVERNFCRDMEGRDGRELFGRQLTDARWLDDELYDLMRMSVASQAFHFNAWVERWGEHRKFACTASDSENLEAIRKFGDYAPDFVFRENSIFTDITDCDFFYDSQMRITSMFPPEPYYLELIGADLALHDALSITAGGIYLDKGHAETQLKFASEYRKLPAVKFNDLPGYSDPVCVRWLDLDGKTYVYTLNREPYSIEVSFECGSESENITLDPFELKVFIYEGEFMPTVSSVKLPHGAVSAYQKDAQIAMDALRSNVDTSKEWSKGVSAVSEQLKCALENGEYSKLRHLLSCYVVKAALLNTSL